MTETLPPDRALDAAIAEGLMGYRRVIAPPDARGQNGGNEILVPRDFEATPGTWPRAGRISFTYHVPQYSDDIRLATELARTLAERGWQFCIEPTNLLDGKVSWQVRAVLPDHITCAVSIEPQLSRAICQAIVSAISVGGA